MEAPAVLGDLVARDRRSDRVACRVVARDRDFSYRDFCTTAWKSASVLRYLGVHAGGRVAIAPRPDPEPLFTFLGSALVGATTTFSVDDADARVVLGHVEDADAAPPDRPGLKRLVYGGPPDDPSVTHWERAVWSENPTPSPDRVSPDDPVLDAHTHRDLLDAAADVVADAGLEADTSVALRAPLSDPRAVVAGVVAPLLAGGTIVLPDDSVTDVADVAVSGDDTEGAPESRVLAVGSVSF